jgi:hypothetical protein
LPPQTLRNLRKFAWKSLDDPKLILTL